LTVKAWDYPAMWSGGKVLLDFFTYPTRLAILQYPV